MAELKIKVGDTVPDFELPDQTGKKVRLSALKGSPVAIFVYPEAWPTHLQWLAMMLVLLSRGAGKLSVDHLCGARYARSSAEGVIAPK